MALSGARGRALFAPEIRLPLGSATATPPPPPPAASSAARVIGDGGVRIRGVEGAWIDFVNKLNLLRNPRSRGHTVSPNRRREPSRGIRGLARLISLNPWPGRRGMLWP